MNFRKLITSILLLAALAHHGSAWVFLQCQFQMRQVHPQLQNVYTCLGTLTYLDVDRNLISVAGAHLPGMNNGQVVHLELVPSQIAPFIPGNFQAHLPNIQHITWRGSNMNTIVAQDLQQFGNNLRSFIAIQNQLTRLPANLFSFNVQLDFLEISQEQLNTVEQNLLGPLNVLNTARFLQNPCINEQAVGRAAVINLNTRLHTVCSGGNVPTPPPPGDCPAGCQTQIQFLLQENQQLRNYTEHIDNRMRRIEDFVCLNAGLLC